MVENDDSAKGCSVAHSEDCRERIAAELSKTAEGRKRLEAVDDRMDKWRVKQEKTTTAEHELGQSQPIVQQEPQVENEPNTPQASELAEPGGGTEGEGEESEDDMEDSEPSEASKANEDSNAPPTDVPCNERPGSSCLHLCLLDRF